MRDDEKESDTERDGLSHFETQERDRVHACKPLWMNQTSCDGPGCFACGSFRLQSC